MECLEEKCPAVLMNTQEYPSWGLRNALAVLFKEKYSFKSEIISKLGEKMDIANVFSDFCDQHEEITVKEIKEFANTLNLTSIYWDTIYEKMVRISRDQFVRRDKVYFDVKEADNILEQLLQGEYVPLKDMNLFLHFPSMNIQWNTFVLESFVSQYSEKFRLLHLSYSASACCGAIVRKSSEFETYDDLITDVLAHSPEWETTKEAFNVLINAGYQQRARYSHIDEIVKNAKLLREQLSKE